MKAPFFYFLKNKITHVMFWGVVWLFFSSFFSVGSQNENFIFWFSTFLSLITLTASYIFGYVLIPKYLITQQYLQFILFSFYAVVFIVCLVLMTVVFGFVFFYNLEFQKMPSLTKNKDVILVCVFLIVALFSSFKLLRYNYQSLDEKKTLENKFLQTQLQLKEQELKFLKMQIHPHFLFNTLNTLYGFALKKSDKTPEMIMKLSSLLDYILYQVDKPSVFLKDELQHLKDYISLEKFRFQSTLHIEFNNNSYDEKTQIPPMLLLPFIENAFKHGAYIDEVLSVIIDLEVTKNRLCFKVQNSARLQNDVRKGIGLENLKKRLLMLYKDKYRLKISEKESTYEINLKIPLNHDT